jgi:hypothetical protein
LPHFQMMLSIFMLWFFPSFWWRDINIS